MTQTSKPSYAETINMLRNLPNQELVKTVLIILQSASDDLSVLTRKERDIIVRLFAECINSKDKEVKEDVN